MYELKPNIERIIITAIVVLAIILILDQLYLFGIPFGPILPDLSRLDPTQDPDVHHWMIGAVMLVGVFLYKTRRKK